LGRKRVWSSYGPQVLAHRALPIDRHHSLRVAFSSDSKIVASTLRDRTILLWDAATGKRQHIFVSEGHPDISTGLASMHIVSLWNVATEERCIFKTLEDHWDIFIGLAFSSDGKMVACKSPDMAILLWDIATEEGHADSKTLQIGDLG